MLGAFFLRAMIDRFTNRIPFLVSAAFYAAAMASTAFASDRPNIILFYADDLGYGDLGSFWQDQKSGKAFDTPALDRMAMEGARLTHHYTAAPVCAPARSSLMQGRHQGHADIRDNMFDVPLPDNHNLGNALQRAGYHTIHIGKAGLAGQDDGIDLSGTGSANLPAHPLDWGFDAFFGYLFHLDAHEHYPRNGSTFFTAHIFDGYRRIEDASLDLYTTDVFTAYAKKAILDEVNDGDEQPFFLYLAYDTPHKEMQRPAAPYPDEDKVHGDVPGYDLTSGVQWTTATDAFGRTRYVDTATGNNPIDGYTHPDIASRASSQNWDMIETQFAAMIKRMDTSIADILQLLEYLGVDENTICVFATDNGPHDAGGHDPRSFEGYAMFEGVKRDILEGGLRVPAIVRWPGTIPSGSDIGATYRDIEYPSAIYDWMPTFIDIAGMTPPAWCDGVSLLPVLQGTGSPRQRDWLYFEYYQNGKTPDFPGAFPHHYNERRQQQQAIRIGDLMGVRRDIQSHTDPFAIYDVVNDPAQSFDLSGDYPDLANWMRATAIQARRPLAAAPRGYIDDVAVPPGEARPFTFAAYPGSWDYVPEFRDLSPADDGPAADLSGNVTSLEPPFGILFEGSMDIPDTGIYTFYLNTSGRSHLFLHEAHLIDNDYTFDGSERSATIRLEEGRHPFRLYTVDDGAPVEVDWQWSGPGIAKEPIPLSAIQLPDSTPVAVNDAYSIPQGTSWVLDVMENDTDDGAPAPLSIRAVSTPEKGSVSLSGNQLTYTADPDFLGEIDFSYTITDGQDEAQATVLVDVIVPVSDAVWLPLDDGTGLVAEEAGGFPLADLIGFASADDPWQPGHSGYGLALNGVDEHLLVRSDYLPPSGTAARSFSAWIKATSPGSLFAYGEIEVGRKWHFRLEDNPDNALGALRIEVAGGFLTGSTNLLDDQWHHIALVFDGTDVTNCRLYVDGVEETYSDSTPQTVDTASGSLMIGRDNHPTPRFLGGWIDELRVYERALSVAEIIELARSTNQPEQAWHYRFTGSTGPPDWQADGDADGLTLLEEYAFSTNPHLTDPSPFQFFRDTGQPGMLRFSFPKRSDTVYPLSYTLEASSDLSDWVPFATEPTALPLPVDSTFYRLEVKLP